MNKIYLKALPRPLIAELRRYEKALSKFDRSVDSSLTLAALKCKVADCLLRLYGIPTEPKK